MTTPAVSEQSYVPGDVKATWKSPYGDGTNTPGSMWKVYHRRVRPASLRGWSNGQADPPCIPWTSEGYDITIGSGTSRREYNPLSTGGYSMFEYKGSIMDFDSGNTASSLVLPVVSSNMRNESLVKCLLRLKNQQIHVGNFMGEIDKTIDMIADRVRKVRMAYRNWRTLHFKDYVRVLSLGLNGHRHQDWCQIPRSYLELQYGWNPLLSDIYGGMQVISKRGRNGESADVNVHYSLVRKEQEEVPFARIFDAMGRCVAKCDATRVCKTYISFGLTSPLLRDLSSLGLINPVEIVWELTPFSFIVDWFLPVSNWLSSLTAATGMAFHKGGQSSFAKRKWIGSSCQPGAKLAHEISHAVSNPSVSGDSFKFDRVCYTSSPVPGLYVKNPLSMTHYLEALALLTVDINDRPKLRGRG